jgi:hypothetical protein
MSQSQIEEGGSLSQTIPADGFARADTFLRIVTNTTCSRRLSTRLLQYTVYQNLCFCGKFGGFVSLLEAMLS